MKLGINIVVLFFLCLTGCSSEPPSPVPLAFGFKSYSTVHEVKEYVAHQGGTWDVVEHTVLSPNDPRPNYDFLKVSINNSILEFDGKVDLTFFNGSLMSVTGYPSDWRSYKSTLEKKYGAKINTAYDGEIRENLRL